MILNITMFALFTLSMIITGVISRKKVTTVNDFFLGGRKAGGILSAFAYGTTYFSAVMITLCGSLGYQNGISVMWIGIFNGIIGGYFAWKVLAKQTRRLSEKLNALTVVELIKKRFDSKFLGILLPLVILVFLVPYSASVYQGLSFVFQSAFGIDFVYCAVILAVTTALYVSFGGYVATMINSLIQGIITVVAVVAFYFAFFKSPVIGNLPSAIHNLSDVMGKQFVSVLGPKPLFIIATVLVTSFGAWGLPQMIHKFFTIKETEINKSAILSAIFCILIAGGMYLCGGFAPLFFEGSGIPAPSNVDAIMPTILLQTTGKFLFATLFVMLICASMSTLSSLVLVSASTFTEDILKGAFKLKIPEKKNLFIMKGMCVLFIVFSILIALVPNKIINLLSLSWGTIASAFMAPYMYAIFGKTTHKSIACSSSVAGLLGMFITIFFWGKEASTYAACIAVSVSFITLGVGIFAASVQEKKNPSPLTAAEKELPTLESGRG